MHTCIHSVLIFIYLCSIDLNMHSYVQSILTVNISSFLMVVCLLDQQSASVHQKHRGSGVAGGRRLRETYGRVRGRRALLLLGYAAK